LKKSGCLVFCTGFVNIVIGIALQFLLPFVAVRTLEEYLNEGLGRPQELAVKVDAIPSVMMPAGRIDGLEITAGGAYLRA